MGRLIDLPVRQKVYAYILQEKGFNWKLLVFKHMDFPEAGVQVPGGTVEPGEEMLVAATREAEEETGLRHLIPIQKIQQYHLHY